MTRDARLFRGALTASAAVHIAAAAVSGMWRTTLIALEADEPASGRPMEVSLWAGAGGDGAPSPAPASPANPSPSTAAPAAAPPTAAAPASDSPENPAPAEPLPSSDGVPADAGTPGGVGLGVPQWRRPTGGGGGGGSGTPGGGTNLYVPPRLLAGALPIDPADSEALHVPEQIPVQLRVGVNGRVREVVPELDDLPPPVLAALQRSAAAMRFTPARRGGAPVEAWFPMTFVYRR